MEGRIDYKKRRKGLLAAVISMTLLVGLLYPPMVAKAAPNNTVYVTGADTSILVGYGDSVGFNGGVYGQIYLNNQWNQKVFPGDGGVDITIENAGECSGTYGTDATYTIEYSGGLCVKETIDFYSYDQVEDMMEQQNGEFPAGANVDASNSFAIVKLKTVSGCKVTYMDENGTVVHTDYVVTDANSPVSGTATTVWGGLTKENAELMGWDFTPGSDSIAFEVGDSLMDRSGLMSLYPVWAMLPEEEPEPEPAPSTPAPKSAGIVNVSMNGYTFGGNSSNPMIVSSTNDVSKATVTYKAAGASDATYSTQKPTAVGDYVVRVALPENDNYGQAVGTANFRISYLPAPTPAYELDGTKGDNGWYKSEVEITPPDGYEMSVGNRDYFTTESYTVDEETSNLRIYLRKITTGEMTDVISIANLRVDADAPAFTEMQDGEEYYEDLVTIDFTDQHFKTVTVNGEVMEVVADENGEYSFAVETGMRRMSYVIVLKDEAGNETKVSLIFGPAWLKDGIVGEGDYYLETGEEYHFPTGSSWVKSGDTTVYAGGSSFYANSEGEVTFGKE